eukprot:Skav210015  [mRNA]  locus=scaffold1212:76068:77842:- [translate_table: standard]
MLASMEHKSEAGVAKRWESSDGRAWGQVTLLSQYQEDFSSYTLKQFMDDYTKARHGNQNGESRTISAAVAV